jgi:hypothetical protein
MCFLIHALEELYPYNRHGFYRVFAPSIINSEIVLSSPLYWDRNGVDSIERAILAIPVIVD